MKATLEDLDVIVYALFGVTTALLFFNLIYLLTTSESYCVIR
jgi:hypothetical protein